MERVNEYHSPAYEYIKINRGAGHTTLIMDGAMNAQYPYFMMGKDMAHARELCKQSKNRFAMPITMNDCCSFKGYRQPVLIDNYVFTETCEGYIRTIRDYREINQRLNGEIERMEKALVRLESLPFWIRLFKPLYRRAIKKAYGKNKG